MIDATNTTTKTRISIIGDLHGHFQEYKNLLISGDLIDEDCNWQGGNGQLWLIGDIFDRGPSGIKCLDLTMRLQQDARLQGGDVQSLLGNHELMLLCVHRMSQISSDLGRDMKKQWLQWGGQEDDLSELKELHVAWLCQLPAMALLGDYLLMHADTLGYVGLGQTIEAVNGKFHATLLSADLQEWLNLLGATSERGAFSGLALTGAQRARSVLKYFGGRQIIHGHTPISHSEDLSASQVTSAHIYASDLCVNVDGGIYLGGPGFLHDIQVDTALLVVP